MILPPRPFLWTWRSILCLSCCGSLCRSACRMPPAPSFLRNKPASLMSTYPRYPPEEQELLLLCAEQYQGRKLVGDGSRTTAARPPRDGYS